MEDRFKFRMYIKGAHCTMWNFDITEDDQMYTSIMREVPVMQCTGLKDKNGTLIYEGDIIKFKTNFLHDIVAGEKQEFIGKVYFAIGNSAFTIENENGGNSAMFNQYHGGQGIEIIGNIYENPELLK